MIKYIYNGIAIKAEMMFGKDLYSFLNHSKNYLSANIFAQSLAVISVPIFTRLLLPKDYGILAILNSFISIFGIIYSIGIGGAVARYYYEEKIDFNSFFGTNIIMLVSWSTLLTLILFIFSDILVKYFNIPIGVIYCGIIIVAFQILYSLYLSYLAASQNSKKVAIMTATNKIVTLIFAIPLIILMTKNKYYGQAYSLLIVAFIFGVYSLYHIWKLISLKFKFEYLRYSLKFSLPILVHQLSNFILGSFDMIMINKLVGSTEAGLYSLAYSVGALQSMVSMGMLQAWSPMFMNNINSRNYSVIDKLASKFSRIVYLSAFFLILFSREMMIVLADEEYYAALDIIPIIIISFVFHFLYLMYIDFAFYHKKTTNIAIFTILSATINIGLNIWLIPKFGYKIAAWTTLLSYLVLFVFHYCNVRFVIKPEWITHLRVLLPNFFVMIGFYILSIIISSLVSNNYIIFAFKMFLMISIFIVFFGKEIFRTFITKSS